MEPAIFAQLGGANVELQRRALTLSRHGLDKDLAADRKEEQRVLVANPEVDIAGLETKFAGSVASMGSSLDQYRETVRTTAAAVGMKVGSLKLGYHQHPSTVHCCSSSGS